MQLNVYFGEKPVYLCDELDEKLEVLHHHPDVVFIDELSSPAINSLLHEIKKESINAGIIVHPDLEKLKKDFFKHFTVIEAAGGIVQNDNKDILFIYRRGKWDLPKGKLEKGEKIEDCALREVEEETGASNLKRKKKIGETYHIYDEFGKHILKVSHWYYFIASGKQTLIPQENEDILQAKWIPTKDIAKPMANTYSTIRDIMAEFFDVP